MRVLPLSALQQRFWYLCTTYTGDTSPILFLTWRIRGPLDVERWNAAVSALVNRHEVLRTGFLLRDGEPLQTVSPPKGIDTELIHVTGEAEAERILLSRTNRLLDLIDGPLVESCLLRLADDHHVWIFTMHHLMSDGASLRIVGREVRAFYLGGSEAAMPALEFQYGDFAVWQREQEAAVEADLAYWCERLSTVPPLELKTDHPRPQVKSTASEELFHQMGPELAAQIVQLSRTARCTPFMVLFAGLQVVLWQRSGGQTDFAVGTPVAGRVRTELEPLVGLFANTLALRADLSGDPTFAELLTRTRTTVINALKRQTVPFGRIVGRLGLPSDPGRTQLFQVIFSMRNDNENKQPELGELHIEDFPHGHPKVLHDMVVDIWRLDENGVRTGIRYDTALFTEDTVVTLARQYERVLSAAVAEPGNRLSQLAAQHG
ncbi:condensation domain-containing protein [Allorhizocola rhizosphaerae]|uniref:condensation domain-containing protein n=1 Tax=Allorhizocola rhizosphaerae TaxID=1872709 RepID=UPI000E3D0F26|nr:condensation domain-containing protein [Allorhizocola rhizosphaerae]